MRFDAQFAAGAAMMAVSTAASASGTPASVQELPSISDMTYGLKSGDFHTSAPHLMIDGYNAPGDGGGGYFVYNSGACAGGADGGVTVTDHSANCFQRVFTGAVHLAWYGITGTSDATTPLTNALAAASSAGHVVDTDALRIYVSGNVVIPAEVRLTCGAAPGGSRLMSGVSNFSQTPASIVTTTSTNSIVLSNANAEFDHCIVLTGGSTAYPIELHPTQFSQAMSNILNMVNNGSTGVLAWPAAATFMTI